MAAIAHAPSQRPSSNSNMNTANPAQASNTHADTHNQTPKQQQQSKTSNPAADTSPKNPPDSAPTDFLDEWMVEYTADQYLDMDLGAILWTAQKFMDDAEHEKAKKAAQKEKEMTPNAGELDDEEEWVDLGTPMIGLKEIDEAGKEIVLYKG